VPNDKQLQRIVIRRRFTRRSAAELRWAENCIAFTEEIRL
jgi:hypothetical protein